ncbi:ribosome small subunit-dependent GTPase A [Sporolactobacillus shoreae]|uniref:Small ribosomal subunit biogenesis GTPase RsgA n=1 Tax=Sporolactobacillus shoreae TaxID=1465501 RepID=A0A4Z0GV96_9BACL|nr:ribosome small subunit-dependent GTPase A [Sporolactobacillus shoreae]TGB00242.1 ribosome small subunit-dependent GTPase A [Sporolactobacillus shoreae]
MPEGTIIKALSGYYYVKDGDDQIQCRARGIFRKRKVTPLVGDRVVYEAENPKDGYIMSIRPRRNFLNRPPVANVDQAVLVFSVKEPVFDGQLLDRFLVHVESHGIRPIICLSKWDLLDVPERDQIRRKMEHYTEIGYSVIYTSSVLHFGLEKVMSSLDGTITVITGQSGVGKSSLLNGLNHNLKIDTQEISQALGRGKHTTRHVELLPVGMGSYIADTPGFSSLDFSEITLVDLEGCFPEFVRLHDSCRFRGCTHTAEPGCAVKEAVADGTLDKERYAHYCFFFQEIQNRKKQY